MKIDTSNIDKNEFELFRFVLDNSSDIIYLYDIIEKKNVYSNKGITHILGYSVHEIREMGENVIPLLMHPDDLDSYLNIIVPKYQETKDKEWIEHDYRMKHKNGDWRWLHSKETIYKRNANGNPEHILGVVSDIINEKNVKNELQDALRNAKKSEERYRGLINHLEAGIVVYNKDTSIVMNNPKAAQLLGLSNEQMRGKQALDPHWHFFDEKGVAMPVEKYPVNLIATSKKILKNYMGGVYRPNTKDKVWLIANGFPVFDSSGEITEIIISFIDFSSRKQVEIDLKLSEEKFHALYYNINVGVALHEIVLDENGKPIDFIFLDVNPVYEKITTLKKEIIIGKRGRDVIPNLEQKWIDLYGKVALTGKPVSVVDHSDFLNKYWEVRAYSPAKNQFAVALNEITDRVVAENQLKENEEKYKSLIYSSPVGMYFYQLEPDQRLILVGANPAAEKMLGIVNKKLIGKTIEEAFPNLIETNIPEMYKKIAKGALGHQSFEIPYKDNRFSGFYKVDAFSDQPNKVAVSFTDISEIKNAKERAEESEEKFKLLNTLTSEMLLLKNLDDIYKFISENLQNHYPNTIVLYVSINDASKQTRLEAFSGLDAGLLKKIIKISRLNPIGRQYKIADLHNKYFKSGNFVEFKGGLVEFSAGEFPAIAASAIEKLIGLHKIYTIGINKDEELLGAIHFLTFNKQTIIDTGFIEVFVKQAGLVIQKKINEEALIIAKEKAEESDRLKTAFLQNISHEIRTPLNAITGFSGMLNKPNLTQEKRSGFVSIIQNSSYQLISIVSDILSISSLQTKQEKLNIDKVSINEIIIELLTVYKQQFVNKNISLYAKQELKDKQSEIYTDKIKITQILSNLLANALKFTHEGFVEFGYRLIKRQGDEKTKQSQIAKLEFYVKDTGIGIQPNLKEKIFERFRQADMSVSRMYGGTGLGLAISKGLIELLGGNMWVESELEKGSTFYFTIPYSPVNKIDPSITPTKQNKKFYTVLVAEDEEFNFLYIEEVLIDMDVKIIHAKDGKEVVEICKANPNIDLILMDIKMPIMDGYDAARLIKKFSPDLPIIAQSAYALEQEIERYSSVFDDYITKPISAEILIEKVTAKTKT